MSDGEVAGQAVEFGDNEFGFVDLAGRQGFNQLGPVGVLAGLDLGELGDQLPPTAI